MFFASRTRDPKVIAVVVRYVVIADWLFTTPTVIMQPASGLLLVHMAGLPLQMRWLCGPSRSFCWPEPRGCQSCGCRFRCATWRAKPPWPTRRCRRDTGDSCAVGGARNRGIRRTRDRVLSHGREAGLSDLIEALWALDAATLTPVASSSFRACLSSLSEANDESRRILFPRTDCFSQRNCTFGYWVSPSAVSRKR